MATRRRRRFTAGFIEALELSKQPRPLQFFFCLLKIVVALYVRCLCLPRESVS